MQVALYAMNEVTLRPMQRDNLVVETFQMTPQYFALLDNVQCKVIWLQAC